MTAEQKEMKNEANISPCGIFLVAKNSFRKLLMKIEFLNKRSYIRFFFYLG